MTFFYLIERVILAWLYLDTYAYYAGPLDSAYYALLLGYECGSQGIDPVVGAAIIHHESGGLPGVISWVGGTDTGLMQIVPEWQPFTQEELKSPAVNIHAGCKALHDWKETYGKGDDYLAHFAGGGHPNKAAYAFQRWVEKRVKKAEKVWQEVPMFFDMLERAWNEVTKRVEVVS